MRRRACSRWVLSRSAFWPVLAGGGQTNSLRLRRVLGLAGAGAPSGERLAEGAMDAKGDVARSGLSKPPLAALAGPPRKRHAYCAGSAAGMTLFLLALGWLAGMG